MTPYELWQLEKYGNLLPDEDPKDDEEPLSKTLKTMSPTNGSMKQNETVTPFYINTGYRL